jgi:kumamolisin
MASALRTAVSRGATVVSISLGTCGTGLGSSVATAAFAALKQRGVTVFVSSGDTGDRPGPAKYCGKKRGVAYPGSDPSVVSVGGTTLRLNRDSTIAREDAWQLSGGGKVASLLRPTWQVSPNIPQGKHRWAPDVAFVADPHTGLSVYFKDHWRQVGGTSMGAPGWAAAWALTREHARQTGQSAPGAASQLLYALGNSDSYGRVFRDITLGSNGRYRAKPGWDAVTGWGTPNVASLSTTLQTASLR